MKLVKLLSIKGPISLGTLTADQVTELQEGLTQAGYDTAGIDGVMGPNTKAAWARFKSDIAEGTPDLIGPASVRSLQQKLDTHLALSGPEWVAKFPNSISLDDLRQPFKASAIAFLGALHTAGVSVGVTSTLRPRQRAYLMHYSKAISDGSIAPSAVPASPDVPIQWVHPTQAESVEAARAMVRAYGIRGPVALNSRHIDGHAIDMDISWPGTPNVQDRSGNLVSLSGRADGDNPHLMTVGASYGVVRGSSIPGDPEHWSIDGH
jgi:hypothetical protein